MIGKLGPARGALMAGLLLVAGCTTTGSNAGDTLIGEWRVVDLSGRSVVENSRVTLVFDAEGRLSGDTSCNGFGTRYTVQGDRITIPRPVATLKACQQALMDQEGRFIELLEQVRTYRIDESGNLLLSTETGRTMTARRA